MKVLKILVISISVCSLCIAASVIIPSDILSKATAQPKLDCKWKCDETKKQCVCYGKDCQTCAGKQGKAYGGGAMVIALQTCSTTCSWSCTGSIDGQCVEWSKSCMTICRGR
jgi:hypothetical protein